MNGYEVFCAYQAVKLHFTTDTYCYFKYNGKVATKPAGFEKRKDVYAFHRLARELQDHEVIPFMVSNMILNDKVWAKDLTSTHAMETYRKWRDMRLTLEATFDADIAAIVEHLNKKNMGIRNMFSVQKNRFPEIWVMMNHGEIKPETVAILHGLTGVLDLWDKHYGSGSSSADYIYEKTSKFLRKYEPFLSVDAHTFKNIVQRHLTY